MIELISDVDIIPDSAEAIKLYETFKCYGDIALFWKQKGYELYISLLDGNMIICGKNADFDELSEFIKMINPSSIFSNESILKGLQLFDTSMIVNVLKVISNVSIDYKSDILTSKEIYSILLKANLDLPEYEYFAPDFCLRLNRNRLKYFAIGKNAVCSAIGTDYILINSMASNLKGNGSIALKGLLSLYRNKEIFVCAAPNVSEFYIKNGFSKAYKAGYWRKK